MNETVEEEITRKGLTAPRVTPQDIDAAIKGMVFFTAHDAAFAPGASIESNEPELSGLAVPLGLLTICVLVLNNGFTIVGKSACASPENFDEGVGRRVALEDAKRQMWPLLGYALREKLAQPEIHPDALR